MKIKTVVVGTSLAAFMTLGVPATSTAASLLGQDTHQVGDKKGKKDDKKKDEKKKDEKGKDGEEGEGACGEGSCSEGACKGSKDKDADKDKKK